MTDDWQSAEEETKRTKLAEVAAKIKLEEENISLGS